MSEHKISISLPKDDKGYIGRECLDCKRYFKVKSGTGLPSTYCYCPYCDYEGEHSTFYTAQQVEYARSLAIKKM